METGHSIRLTSAEISQLWTQYQNDSMAACQLKYFIQKVEDLEVKQVLQFALRISEEHILKVTTLFNEEKFPIPIGFNNEDVNLNAPRLYSDTFALFYVLQLGGLSLSAYSLAVALASRSDIHKHFSKCLNEAIQLHKNALEASLQKGVYIRAPYISTPTEPEYVTQQNFLTGWLGERRPLTSIEITNLYANIQRNSLGSALLIGYSQVAKNPKIIKYFVRGKEIANKHVEVFGSLLREEDLPIPMTWDSDITDSTVAPFSEKLMMFQTAALIGLSIGFYGASMAASPRRDIGLQYSRVSGEIAKYAEDGANIMIDHGWLEKPPSASDRDKIAFKK
ncbi:DUF3231 family protein [Cytobacillus sp. FJAT-54145]|uniref:DUF3231 family protein n=1 Tax=Cytobacillus spartinae TaxID=3299023 RepID=A0ABW6KET5_9BACI